MFLWEVRTLTSCEQASNINQNNNTVMNVISEKLVVCCLAGHWVASVLSICADSLPFYFQQNLCCRVGPSWTIKPNNCVEMAVTKVCVFSEGAGKRNKNLFIQAAVELL